MPEDTYLIRGERVVLRPAARDDGELLHRCWHDLDVQRNLNFRDDGTLPDVWWREELRNWRSWLRCVIVSLADGAPAGMVSLGSIAADPELIVLLLPEFRGRGIGTEAAGLIIDYGFATMGVSRIGGGAFDFNTASQGMLSKLGFTRTPGDDATYHSQWGPGTATELAYHLDRSDWLQIRTASDPVRPIVFDARPALETIRALDIVRVCGSEGERQAAEVITRRLDTIGVPWHYHTFLDDWVEPEDPHLLVRGRRIPVRPVMELGFQSGFEFMADSGLRVDVRADLATTGDYAGKITVATEFDPSHPVEPSAPAHLMAFPFSPQVESYLWAQTWEVEKVPAAWVAPEDIPFVVDSLGEPAVLRWGATSTQREFRNLVAEIPGTRRPQEIVLIGAHIDSFPGTVGSSDDAAGCAVLVEAARWFAAHPPSRTVRLVWFTGEELDRRGSHRYAAECVPDAGSVKLMVCVDGGCEVFTGPMRVYASREETPEWARNRANTCGMELHISESRYTDAGAFSEMGVPTFMASGPSKQPAHLPDDRPENIDPHKLQTLGSLSLEAAMSAAYADT